MILGLMCAFIADRPSPVQFPSELTLVQAPPVSDIPTEFASTPGIYRDGWVDLNKNNRKDVYEDPRAPIERRLDDLLSQMTTDEKTCQLATLYGWKAVLKDQLPTKEWKSKIWKDGIANIDEQLNSKWGGKDGSQYFWPPSRHAAALNEIQRFFVEQTRLGVPVDFTNEGIQGCASFAGTHFPIPTGMGATWDLDLIRREGEITGLENRLLGFTTVYAPILDVVRDQRWGRSEESFSEDPFLLTQMGVTMAKAIQAHGSASCAKHFAVYSFNKGAREGLSRTDPHVAPRMMEEIALKPFRAAVEQADLLGVMASYNDYDGVPIAASKEFLSDRLRKQWGFRGYVVSDSDAVEYVFTKHHVAPNYEDAVRQVLQAGLNVRTTFTPPEDFIIPVRSLVKKGFLSKSDLDARVRDVLRVKFWLGLFDSPYRGDLAKADSIVASDQHQEVALQAARESLVLLKNRNAALPLDRRISKISVIGPNAINTDWAHKQYGPMHVDVPTVLDQIKQIAGQSVAVEYAKGCSIITSDFPNDELYERELSADEQKGFDEAIAVARRSDTVILVLGENNQTSGESRTRSSLNLPGRQEKLARELAKLGKPMIAVVIAGRLLTINWLQDNVDAILFGFSPGAKGPRAIAETLFGFNNPSGKMPVTTPKSVGQIPYNFPTKPAANEEGMSRLAAVSGALYPFGFGLSYTTFKYSDIKLESDSVKAGDDVVVSFSVTNSGDRIGTEISQVYFRQQTSSVTTYERRLGGFVRITLAPKETKRTTVRIPGAELAILDRKMKWRIETGKFQVFVGGSSADTPLNSLFEVR